MRENRAPRNGRRMELRYIYGLKRVGSPYQYRVLAMDSARSFFTGVWWGGGKMSGLSSYLVQDARMTEIKWVFL